MVGEDGEAKSDAGELERALEASADLDVVCALDVCGPTDPVHPCWSLCDGGLGRRGAGCADRRLDG